jgi:hypothetical protein
MEKTCSVCSVKRREAPSRTHICNVSVINITNFKWRDATEILRSVGIF